MYFQYTNFVIKANHNKDRKDFSLPDVGKRGTKTILQFFWLVDGFKFPQLRDLALQVFDKKRDIGEESPPLNDLEVLLFLGQPLSLLDEMSRVLEMFSQEHREFEKTMINKLDILTDNVSQQILSTVSSFHTALSSIEAKVDSLVQGVDNVRTEVEGTRVDVDTVVEGADSEMCPVKNVNKYICL
ncbi:hypothetical protein BASA61_005719 [Batrachochytrium salamandrivorans]|nr:hypothetical protein BASA61_005719 [Batrachochytrium salamandrivorans]